MALLCITWLASFAVAIELFWRSRTVDEHGTLHPSPREQAMAERYRRAVERHEQRRRKRATPTGDDHGRRSSRSR